MKVFGRVFTVLFLAFFATDAQATPVEWNGHFYEAIAGVLSWSDAKAAAESLSYGGVSGHLVTITAAEENVFAWTQLGSVDRYWLGGYQLSGSSEPSGGWVWLTGEPMIYTNWRPGEPNNYDRDEGYLAFLGPYDANWNDVGGSSGYAGNSGYIVEYDTPSSVPEPSTMLLLGSGLLGLVGLNRRRKA